MKTYPNINIIYDEGNGIKIPESSVVRIKADKIGNIWLDEYGKVECVGNITPTGLNLNREYDWFMGNIEGYEDLRLIATKKGALKL